MKTLVKRGFNKDDITSFGNMFLLANGRLGYRGTLEEYSKDELVGLNVGGFYDRYQDLWRETVNLPNPFHIVIKNNNILLNDVINHQISLDIEHALFIRKSEFESLIISSERFVSSVEENLLASSYKITSKKEQDIELFLGMDDEIWDTNGPHFKKKNYRVTSKGVSFVGKTNENKIISEVATYKFKGFEVNKVETGYILKTHLLEGESREILIFARVFQYEKYTKFEKLNKKIYKEEKKKHSEYFNSKFNNSRIEISGDKASQDELDYSVYHLCILSSESNKLSIAARGLSGQTYKGAIFWDTEVFLVPFYLFTDPKIARNCLLYRINTLKEAIENAKTYNYSGAFYPWESQEGKEMCSKYNVTDVFTGKPIRTYFNEKQVHTSADMVISLNKYLTLAGDMSLLNEGGLEMMKECIKFYMSYGKEVDGKIHFNDVIGPDEYHERVNDNMFTNYSIKVASQILLKYLPKKDNLYDEVNNFINKIYLIPVNKEGIIEQFDGYFNLEDVDVKTVASRIRHPREYWGGENGVATKTKVIKQADVVAMLALHKKDFDKETIVKNYHYYLRYTEHGSSLSSSMYAICALEAKDNKKDYEMFRKSSGIDLGTNQKMYAGGIYIGGTHPASNAGAYLDVVCGFCGLDYSNGHITFKPKLPARWNSVSFKIHYQGKRYKVFVNKVEGHMEEIKDD